MTKRTTPGLRSAEEFTTLLSIFPFIQGAKMSWWKVQEWMQQHYLTRQVAVYGKNHNCLGFDGFQIHPWVNYEQILQKCLVGRLVAINPNIDTEALFFGEKRSPSLKSSNSSLQEHTGKIKINFQKWFRFFHTSRSIGRETATVETFVRTHSFTPFRLDSKAGFYYNHILHQSLFQPSGGNQFAI